MNLDDFYQKKSDSSHMWFPRINQIAVVPLTRTSGEIIVAEDFVVCKGKVKITDYEPQDSLPTHQVKVRRDKKISGCSSEYSYTAEVIDDGIQQNTKNAQNDAQERRTNSDPLSDRRSSMMSNINGRTM